MQCCYHYTKTSDWFYSRAPGHLTGMILCSLATTQEAFTTLVDKGYEINSGRRSWENRNPVENFCLMSKLPTLWHVDGYQLSSQGSYVIVYRSWTSAFSAPREADLTVCPQVPSLAAPSGSLFSPRHTLAQAGMKRLLMNNKTFLSTGIKGSGICQRAETDIY